MKEADFGFALPEAKPPPKRGESMNTAELLLIVAGASVIWNIVTSIRIYHELKSRGIEVSFLWLRVMAPFYAHRYKKITQAETGHSGSLYYQWVGSINLALVLVVVTIILLV